MNQPEITDLFPEPSYDELEQALQEWMNPETADADVAAPSNTASTSDDEDEDEAQSPAPAKKSAPAPKVDDVASAFNDLFN